MFVYVVVLNLAFQFVPGMIAETFAMSLLTAVLLKLVVEAVLKVKKAVLARRAAASTGFQRVTSVAMLVLILRVASSSSCGSKTWCSAMPSVSAASGR